MIFNNASAGLKQKEAEYIKQQELAEQRKKAFEAEREQVNALRNAKEQSLINGVNAIFAPKPSKFKAKLSEDGEFIELYSPQNKLTAKFTKGDRGEFVAIMQDLSELTQQQDIDLGACKGALYANFKAIFANV